MVLSDRHLILLSAAAQHARGLLTRPAHLVGGAAWALSDKLIRHGLIEEVVAERGDPVWRRDEEGNDFGLRITMEGKEAIGIGDDDSMEGVDSTSGSPPDRTVDRGSLANDQPIGEASPTVDLACEPLTPAPRASGKQALVLELLRRTGGASIDELMVATGWQAHSTRAVLTGLRHKGHAIVRDAGVAGSRYRIALVSVVSVHPMADGDRERAPAVLAKPVSGEEMP